MEVTALLSIANVSEEDAGRYSCSANFLGASVTREVYVSLTSKYVNECALRWKFFPPVYKLVRNLRKHH